MRSVSLRLVRLALLAAYAPLLAPALAAQAAAQVAAPPLTTVAHSALVTLEVAVAPAGVTLHLKPTSGAAPLSVTGLAASIDGKSVPLTPLGVETWSAPWPDAAAVRERRLELTVSHDGIREVLSATLPLAVAGAAPRASPRGILGDHQQLAWWVLNIVVVLIAAIAISRRTS